MSPVDTPTAGLLVTMPFRNPTRPTVGAATCAFGATSAVAAWVAGALLAAPATNAFAVGTTLDAVTVADDSIAVSTGSTTAIGVAGVGEAVVDDVLVADRVAVAASTVMGCVEFDSVSARVDVGC